MKKLRKMRFYEQINGRTVMVGSASYEIYDVNKVPYEKMPFIVLDLADLVVNVCKTTPMSGEIVHIMTFRIFKKYRNRGFGSKHMKALCETFMKSKDCIICIKSAPLIADYPKEPDRETHIAELIKQGWFLEMNGFRDINSLCDFESGVAYLYMNDTAKPILKQIINNEIDS